MGNQLPVGPGVPGPVQCGGSGEPPCAPQPADDVLRWYKGLDEETKKKVDTAV
jgi:hypothetical protein